MSDRSKAELRRDRIRLVVVNESPRPKPASAASPKPASRPTGGFDQRILDLAAVLFAIGLAFLLAYVFDSLDHADKTLFCLLAGGLGCT